MKRKKISKAISLMLALVMVITMMPAQALAAVAETTTGTATVTMLNESNEEACEYNAIFDAKAEITASKDVAKLKILAANPLPNFKEQKQATFGDFTIIEGAGSYNVAAVPNSAPGQMMSAREPNATYGLEQNKQYSALSFTFNLAIGDISEGKIFKIKTKLGFGEKENQEVIFRLKLTNVDVKVPAGPDMQAVKKQVEAKLAEIDAMNPEEYPADKWNSLQQNVKYVKENINDPSKLESEGEMWLRLLQRGIEGLGPAIKPEKPGTEIKLDDGVYSVPVQGFSDFKKNLDEQRKERAMIYPNALLKVEGGKANVTMRICGYDSFQETFVLKQQYMNEYEKSGNLKHCQINENLINFEHPNKNEWKGYEIIANPKEEYYMPSNVITVNHNKELGYSDITFPLTDINLDTVMRMFPKYDEANKNACKYPTTIVVDFNQANINKLDVLPTNGEYSCNVNINDGSQSTNRIGDAENTKVIQNCFSNGTATVQDGVASVKIPVLNNKVDYIGEMISNTEGYNFRFYKKTIQKKDYKAAYEKGVLTLKFDVKSYEDILFGKRIRITTSDMTELEHNNGLYGGLAISFGEKQTENKIKLEDGVYSVPVQGFSNFKRNKEEDMPQRRMLYSNALINVKNGKAELTMRICGYDSFQKSFVVDQKYMKEIEDNYNTRKKPYYYAVRKDRFDFDHTNLSPQSKKSWIGYDVTTSPDAKDYYLPDKSIATKDYPNMGYTDVTIPITDLDVDAAMYMFQNEANKNQYPVFLVIDIDNARVEKLGELPQNGEFPLSVIIEDGSYSSSTAGTVDDKSTNTIKSMFGNAEATIQDGTAKVNIPVINEKVDYVGEMSKRTKDTFIYFNNLNRKTIKKGDYSSIFSNGCASMTLDFKSYEDFVFGKRIRITTNDLPEAERSFGYYGGIRFSIDKAENVELVDHITGIKFNTDTFNVDKNSKLNVQKIDESNSAYNSIDGFYGAYKNYEAYDINVTNNNENVNINKSGIISIPVPNGWNEKRIIVDRMKSDGHFEDGPKFEIKNGYITFETSKMGKWILAEKQNYDVSTKLENGTYDVNVVAWNMKLDQPSMAAKGIVKKAKLVVKDGVRTIYLNLKSTSQQGLSSYMSNMWIYEKGTVIEENGYPSQDAKLYDAVPYKYYRGEDGKHLVDVYNKDTLNFYPENIYFELPTDKYEFPVKFKVPVMDSLQEGDMTREARFRIDYESAVKTSNEIALPPINDAIKEELEIINMLKKADYTPGSWKVLIDAKEKLVTEQSTATFEQLQTDYYAMRTARYALVESKVNFAALENKINEAKGYRASQYTEDSFNALQNAITAAESVLNNNDSKQDAIDSAVSSLNTAIGNLVPVTGPDISTGLADGDYLIETTMLHEAKDQPSMCNIMFDRYAKATVSGENATVKLYVANPVPAFPDQGADGTLNNFVINYNGQKYEAKSEIKTGAKFTAKDTNDTFGFEAGKQYAAQVLTIKLPKEALSEQYLTVNTYVNVVMNTDVVFRIRLDNIKEDTVTPDIPGGDVTPVPPVEPEKPAVKPEVTPAPILPVEPPKTGADLGMDKDQQIDADKTIGEIITDIVNPTVKPEPPKTEAEKETAATEEKIAEAAKNNDKIKVNVETEKVDEEKASDAIKKEIADIKDKVKEIYSEVGGKLLQFADIKVTATAVKADGTTEDLGNLRNLDKKLSFTFQLPKNTEGDKFGVIRYHDGKAEIIPATDVKYDPLTKKITFLTDKFSTYAVFAYDKEPEVTPVPPVRPAKVQNLKVRTDYGLLKVTFDKSKEDVELYRIAVRKHGDKAWRYYETKNNSLIIKKLNGKALVKSARYDVMVAAVKDKAENIRSYYTKVKTVYANKSGVKAYKMYSPKFESIKRYNSGKTKVVVRNVKYTGETYQVAFRVKGTKTWKNTHYNTKTVRYIKGLKKGKTYQFKVNYRYKSKLDGKTYVYSNSVYKYAKIR